MPLYFYPIAKQWQALPDHHLTRINSGEKRCRAGDCLDSSKRKERPFSPPISSGLAGMNTDRKPTG